MRFTLWTTALDASAHRQLDGLCRRHCGLPSTTDRRVGSTIVRKNPPKEKNQARRVLSIRAGLLIAFALVVFLVSGSLLTASLLGTERLARDVAGSLMFALGKNADIRLHDLFDPIGQKLVEDYAAIRQGRYSTKNAEMRQKLLVPVLFSLPQVDSMMAVDETGGHLLVMRYDKSVRGSLMLAPAGAQLPVPDSGRLQFITRDFRPVERGEKSHFALWDDAGRKLVREWDQILPAYDGRQRPWFKAAMAAFQDQTLPEAQANALSLVGWTEPYTLFITKTPGISAAVAGRDPAGDIQIVTYNLPLNDIARFTMSVQPSPHGMMFVMTDDGRLLGPPRLGRAEDKPTADMPGLQPIAKAGLPSVAQAVATWHADRRGQSDRFRLPLHGEAWWAGFTPFEIGSGRRLWIGILLPEFDLIPAARQYQWLMAGVGLLALLAGALLALLLARWFSKPLTELAGQSRRIAALDLTEAAPVRSHLTEIDLLSITLGRMRDSLQQHISEREHATDRQGALEEQLRAAQKLEAIGRLAGGVAHDFNNLLGVILGETELTLDDMTESDPRRAGLERIKQAAERSAALTRQLLAFARRQPIAPQVLDLNKTVESMLHMLRRLMGEDVALSWQPGRELRQVKIDPSQVDQLLANLCVNARDAIAGVGKVTIETSNASFDNAYCAEHGDCAPGGYVMLAVSDDGCGMTREVQERIFEPFFTTKEVGKGTGLGLSTVYGIVKQNDGFITVRSEPGQGTTFRIYLRQHQGLAAMVESSGVEALPHGHGETVLLVEDDPSVLTVAQTMLERLGFKVLPAATPNRALAIAAVHGGEIHLLVTDVIMPEMNGRDLYQRLAVQRPGLKCLYVSGYTADLIAHHGVLDPGVNFLPKPISLESLSAKLRDVLAENHRPKS